MRIPSRAVMPFLVLAILVVGFLTNGCGSDDNPAAPAGPTAASGNVNKAPIVGATVNIHRLNTDGSIGGFVAGPFTTDASGNWSGTIPTGQTGPFVMVSTGGSYTDEATSNLVTLPVDRELYGIYTSGSCAVTPLTHATFEGVQAMVDGGETLSNAISQATTSSTTAFGLSFTTTTPLNAPTATADQKEYAALLGGISTLLNTTAALGAFTNTLPIDLVIALAKDMADGKLDGLDAGGTVIQVPTDPSGTSTLPLPALSPSDLSAWLTAANTYAASQTDLAGITFPTGTVWDPSAPPTGGGGGGTVTFDGTGKTHLPSITFTATTSDIPSPGQYRWGNAAGVQILIVLVDDQVAYPGKVRTLYVSYGGYVWNAFNGVGLAGINVAGNTTTFSGATAIEISPGTTSSLTLTGGLDNPPPPPVTLHFSGTGTGPLGSNTDFTPDISYSYLGTLYWVDSTHEVEISVIPASATDVATITVTYTGTVPSVAWMVDDSSGPTGATFSGGETIFAGSNLNEQGGSTVLTLTGSLTNPAMTP